MIKDRKIIGVCITSLNEYSVARVLDTLWQAAKSASYKIIIFNSFLNFSEEDEYAEGASFVYKYINYDKIDVIVTISELFKGNDVLNKIKREASSHGIPHINMSMVDPPELISSGENTEETDMIFGLISNYIESMSESIDHTLDIRTDIIRLYDNMTQRELHEEQVYSKIDKILNVDDMDGLHKVISELILPDSYTLTRMDFLKNVSSGNERALKSLNVSQYLISAQSEKDNVAHFMQQRIINSADMIAYPDEWLRDESMYIFNAIYVKDMVCGFYIAKTTDVISDSFKIKRVSRMINVGYNTLISRMRERIMKKDIARASFVDSLTELPNIKGITSIFEKLVQEHKNKIMTVSVYGLPGYKSIYENYGLEEIEDSVIFVAEALKTANPERCYIGRNDSSSFVVINYYNSADEISGVIDSSVRTFYSIMDGYNLQSEKNYCVEVNCGCTSANTEWNISLEGYIKFATSTMYMNRMKYGVKEVEKEITSNGRLYPNFDKLIKKNLFYYQFQPVVSAHNGKIIAYEALMRTPEDISMSPLQILDTAKEYGRLYDIERATFFNVMKYYDSNKDKFNDKKIFVNSIPGFFLNSPDRDLFSNLYNEYFDNVVFEITEQDSVSDEEINFIKSFGNDNDSCMIAIDDYGVGHSNIVNLIRYSPDIIKIDRFLIQNIFNDKNKQMFVRNTIDYARMNGIKVLAEGVETKEELLTVIRLGVDFLQGYYIARPSDEIICKLPDDIIDEIINA